jgi:DNA invertase Pin-like site-specific DNA recombinase
MAAAAPTLAASQGERRPGFRSGGLGSPSDSLNREIIRMLEKDGRVPFATIAEALGVSERTVRRDWVKARLWLAEALQ